MKIVVAIDSFKGSMSSLEAGNAAAEGVLRAFPQAEVAVRPVADGGEGTVEALTDGMGGFFQTAAVTGPLGGPVECRYGIIPKRGLAIIETAGAAGLTLIEESRRNPLYTTTYGVGEVILDALGRGCRRFIIGIGGSATNDGGAGMLQALGARLTAADGRPVKRGAQGLSELADIGIDGMAPELRRCTFLAACDVTNPLCGVNGCSMVFGPQKGAGAELAAQMDGWLAHFAELTKRVIPDADAERPGAGAAGGLGFALLNYLGAPLRPGTELVFEETRLEEEIEGAELVITGEGRLDEQTAMGKAPSGVARLAKKYGVPVLAFAGAVSEEAGICNSQGIDAYFPILRRVVTLEEAMKIENARANMAAAAEQAMRLWLCAKGR